MAGRIDWTLTEQSDWYAAFVEALKKRKVEFPVRQSDLKDVMESAREALLVLKVERRRPMASIDAIRGDYAQRLVDNGIFPRDYLDVLRRTPRAPEEPEVDPREVRITELEARLQEVSTLAASQKAEIAGLQHQLSKTPKERDVVVNFFADILYAAKAKEQALIKPELRITTPPVDLEAKANADAERKRLEETSGEKRIRIAIVGGKDPMHQLVHAEVGKYADMRYFSSDDRDKLVDSLRQFKMPGYGKIFLWSDAIDHGSLNKLKSANIPFEYFSGQHTKLIERIKAEIIKMRQ